MLPADTRALYSGASVPAKISAKLTRELTVTTAMTNSSKSLGLFLDWDLDIAGPGWLPVLLWSLRHEVSDAPKGTLSRTPIDADPLFLLPAGGG